MSQSQSAMTPQFSNQLNAQQIALLRSLRNGTLLPQLLRSYRDQAIVHIENLRAAAAREDAEAVRLAAHSLKSASFSIGATAIGELCAQLETNARTHRMAGNAPLCGELIERFSALLTEIESHLTP